MRRREMAAWEPTHRASVRHRVAVEAARLLYSREMKEYYQAKREAARRQGTTQIPTNREVHEQLLRIAQTVDSEGHARRLGEMRDAALKLMQLLAAFQPKLIGSVLTGHIRKGSDIDLNVFSEELDDVCEALRAGGHPFEVDVVRSRKGGEAKEFVHIRLADVDGYDAEITVYPLEELHTHPRCGITGGPMKRATLAECRQLFGVRAVEVLRELPETPWTVAQMTQLVPELSACGGVLQNHYHHLDVYHHTLEVVAGLERMLTFQRFPKWSELLRRHFVEPRRVSVLFLAALCHDLGKPATQSWGRDGRIRFHGHEQLSAEMVPGIARRLGLSASETAGLAGVVACHMEALMIPVEGGEPSRIHRLFEKLGPLIPELALLSLADAEAARGPAQTLLALEEQEMFVDFLLQQFFEGGFLANPVVPVSVDDLVETFGLTQAKAQKRVLDWLKEGFVDGEFSSQEEGLSLAAEFLEAGRIRD